MNPLIGRRNFLKQSVSASVSVGALYSLSQATLRAKAVESKKGVELAIATICVDGFGDHRHEPTFRFVPELGFKNVEFNLWYPGTLTPRYIDGIKERCDRAGLTPISVQGTGFGGEGRNGVIKDLSHKMVLLDHCERLNCRIVKCTGSRRGTQGGLKSVIEVLKELAPVAEAKRLVVVLENHANNVMEGIADYEEIFAAIDSPNVGMCLDTGHFEGVNVDLIEVVDRFHERILHVDLKDCKERGKGHDTVPFGEGVTDFEGFLSHLMAKGYQGYLVVEQAWSEPKGDWVNDLKAAYQRFRQWES
jgi:sugar phosphate isomerase/epimerase